MPSSVMNVMPAGDLTDWQSPSFEANYQKGKLYGRGVQDDKGGPSLAALYAVNSLLDQGIQFKTRTFYLWYG